MYVASYNDVAHNNGTSKGGLSTEYSTKDAPGYIYKVNGELYNNNGWSTALNSIDNTGYNSMYAKSGTYWWLASPSSSDSYAVCSVSGDYASLNSYYYDATIGVGPLVSLPSTFTVEVEQ